MQSSGDSHWPPSDYNIFQNGCLIIVLSFTYTALFYVFCIFFLQVSKTTHLLKVQQSGRHCMFTKIEGNVHAQSMVAPGLVITSSYSRLGGYELVITKPSATNC